MQRRKRANGIGPTGFSFGCARQTGEGSFPGEGRKDERDYRSNMLPKQYKLRGEYRIERVFEKGQRQKSALLRFYYYPNRIGPRMALTIANSFKLNAVQRNRARRRIFSATEKLWPFAKGKNYDMVLSVRDRKVLLAPFSHLMTQIQSFFEKLP